VERITIPEVWHIQANSKQNAATTFSWTLLEKLKQAQWLTTPPFTIFCKLEKILITSKKPLISQHYISGHLIFGPTVEAN
jgi:hypothetical protein